MITTKSSDKKKKAGTVNNRFKLRKNATTSDVENRLSQYVHVSLDTNEAEHG